MRKSKIALLSLGFIAANIATYAHASSTYNYYFAKHRAAIKKAKKKFKKCGIFSKGYKKKFSAKGQRRILLKRSPILLSPTSRRTYFQIRVYNLDTCEPHRTTVWYLNILGRNIDLGKGSEINFYWKGSPLDFRKMRAWGSKKSDLVFLIKEKQFSLSVPGPNDLGN